MSITIKRIYNSAKSALPKSAKTVWWLLKIILPISFAVSLLQYYGFIAILAEYLTPLFSGVGLPGESAIVFISSIFLSLYAPIAIMATLALDLREVTILALMCLISHNMFVESAVQKKTGSSYLTMFILRIFTSFVAAFLLNYFLPDNIGTNMIAEKAVTYAGLPEMIVAWLKSSGWLILKIVLIVTGLLMLQNILKEFKIIDVIAKLFAPVMRVMGLSESTSFLWFVAQIVGLTYGSVIMIESVQRNEVEPADADLLNYHIAINHSLLEDTLLFVAVGVPAIWITAPRILLAVFVVWIVRLVRSIKKL